MNLNRFRTGKVSEFRKTKREIIVLVLLLTCGVVMGGYSSTHGAEKGPIKIGFISPKTGNFAQMGTDMADAFNLFLEEIGYQVAGRKIEVIYEDEGAGPATAVNKMRKLIQQDKINLVAGIFFTPAAYAITPMSIEAGIPVVITLSAGDDLTQRKRSDFLIRVSMTGCQLGHPAGDYAHNKLGWRKVATISWDQSYGHELTSSFHRAFEDAGGKVIQKVWVPMGTMDFGPFVASLNRNADGIFTVITGTASVRFLKAMRAAGAMDKWKVLAAGTTTDESNLPGLADDGVGVYSVDTYSAALKNPINIKFREKVTKMLKRDSNANMACCYTGADWITRAIKAVSGNVEDKGALLKALRSVEISDSPRGPLKLDQYGHVIQNMYIRRVEKVGNTYENTVVETYPMTSQFFRYNPEEYLKQPVYTRDNPPCKFCE